MRWPVRLPEPWERHWGAVGVVVGSKEVNNPFI